ncbi:MAG: cytochrome c biogenesis heme-transporting ATPase CcmA [Woeseiaceae bacterium]
MTALLSAHGLRVYRGERCLFDDVGFALEPGELLLIVGANGSGKTSLLRAIAGLLLPDNGEIRWRGQLTGSSNQQFRAELGWLAHRLGLKYDLSVAENLDFDAGLRGADRSSRRQILDKLNIANLQGLPLRSLSAGQQRRVALSRLLESAATLWLMDEPFTHLDSTGQALVTGMVGEHLASGGVAAIATHHPIELPVVTHRLELQ